MGLTFTDGSQASTTSEADLFDITLDAHFATWIFTHNMASGDILVIRVYTQDTNASATMRLFDAFTLQGAQTKPAYFIPFLATKQYKVTIQRTGGTDRTYTWQRIEVT